MSAMTDAREAWHHAACDLANLLCPTPNGVPAPLVEQMEAAAAAGHLDARSLEVLLGAIDVVEESWAAYMAAPSGLEEVPV